MSSTKLLAICKIRKDKYSIQVLDQCESLFVLRTIISSKKEKEKESYQQVKSLITQWYNSLSKFKIMIQISFSMVVNIKLLQEKKVQLIILKWDK